MEAVCGQFVSRIPHGQSVVRLSRPERKAIRYYLKSVLLEGPRLQRDARLKKIPADILPRVRFLGNASLEFARKRMDEGTHKTHLIPMAFSTSSSAVDRWLGFGFIGFDSPFSVRARIEKILQNIPLLGSPVRSAVFRIMNFAYAGILLTASAVSALLSGSCSRDALLTRFYRLDSLNMGSGEMISEAQIDRTLRSSDGD